MASMALASHELCICAAHKLAAPLHAPKSLAVDMHASARGMPEQCFDGPADMWAGQGY